MPVYEYRCSCGQTKEVVCKYSERPEEISCPECKGVLQIVPSCGSFVMKGYRASNGYSISEDIQNRK